MYCDCIITILFLENKASYKERRRAHKRKRGDLSSEISSLEERKVEVEADVASLKEDKKECKKTNSSSSSSSSSSNIVLLSYLHWYSGQCM